MVISLLIIAAVLALVPAPRHQDTDATWRQREEDSMK